MAFTLTDICHRENCGKTIAARKRRLQSLGKYFRVIIVYHCLCYNNQLFVSLISGGRGRGDEGWPDVCQLKRRSLWRGRWVIVRCTDWRQNEWTLTGRYPGTDDRTQCTCNQRLPRRRFPLDLGRLCCWDLVCCCPSRWLCSNPPRRCHCVAILELNEGKIAF